MKTILYSELIRRTVNIPHERTKGKLVEIVARRGKKYWPIEEIMIESGLIDKKADFYMMTDLEELKEEGTLALNTHVSGRERPAKKENIFLSKLIKSKVVDNEEEEYGRVYDFEIIQVNEDQWIVWKILADPAGLSPRKKRLRIPTVEVQKLSSDKVFVNM